MIINKELLDNLTEQAKNNPRLRQAYDLRTTPDDNSQRILNAVEPGTVLPIHRHRSSTETITCIRGKCVQYLYEEVSVPYNPVSKDFPQGMDNQYVMTRKELKLVDAIAMEPNSDVIGMSVDVGQWHRLESLESGTVILECKDGKYEPLAKEDIFEA